MRTNFLASLLFLLLALPASAWSQGEQRLQQLENQVSELNQSATPDEVKLGTLHLQLAQAYHRAGKVGQARLNADLAKEAFSETRPEFLPVVENLRGSLALAAGDQFEALAAFNEGLNSFYWGIHRGLPRPHPDSIHGRQFAEATILLGNRATLLANSNRPLEAFLDYELLFLLEDQRRQSLSAEELDAYPGQNIRQYYDAAVTMLVDQSLTSGDASLLWDAFALSERGKIYGHRENLRRSPSERAHTIRRLEQRITELSAGGSGSASGLEAARAQVERLRHGREKMSLREVTPPPGRSILPALETADKTLVSFHVGADASHVFIIHPNADTVAYRRLPPAENLGRAVAAFRRTLSDPGSGSAEELARFRDLSTNLYGQLFGDLIEGTGNLLLLPDGPLHAVPFSCLVSPDAPAVAEFGDLPYLGVGRALQRARSSAILLEEPPQREAYDYDFLQFTPASTPAASTGSSTAFRTDDNYLREEFIAIASSARVVELEVSGAEVFAPSQSYLSFAPSAEETSVEQALSFADIAALDLMNDLLVLHGFSAELSDPRVDGEPLANAFLAAGVNSVIATQWPVSGESRSALLEAFYANSKAGLPRDAALSAARAQLLNGKYQHPHYWATASFSGRALPQVPGEEGGFQLSIFGVVGGLFGGVFVWWMGRGSKRKG
ncbi:CHAT domain-containing protein [Lewinella sp. 4G2]|uniref:CHAT domain-containing protein n=1 Tax=Lewinella sp. 4G2 TaxID=1803372 RepID=UPI0007B4AE72|nr:CHAT domain-containing protein [Lewinella sp. 4G2]OAV42993.1 hypothetical protein A3850_000080 [Lewinella sp. 4G2]